MCPRQIRYPVVVPLDRHLLSRSRRLSSRHRALSNPRRRGRPRRTRRRHRALGGLSLRSSRMSPRQCQQVALGNLCQRRQRLASTFPCAILNWLNRCPLGYRRQSTGRRWNQHQLLRNPRSRRRRSRLRHPLLRLRTCPRVLRPGSCRRRVAEGGTGPVTVRLRVVVFMRHPRTRVTHTGLAMGALRTVAQAVCHPMETVRIRPAMEVCLAVSVRIQCIPTSRRVTDGTV
jgi:hypothetical protein